MKPRLSVAVSLLFLIFLLPLAAFGERDVSNLDPLWIVEIDKNGDYSWHEHYENKSVALGKLGKVGDLPIAGRWITSEITSIGTISLKKDGSLLWRVKSEDGTLKSINFGSAPATVIIGADIDGSGLNDAIVVKQTEDILSPLEWVVRTDPFASSAILLPQDETSNRLNRSEDNSKNYNFTFGHYEDTLFFFNSDGIRDRLVSISPKEPKASIYDFLTKAKSSITLPPISHKTDKIYPFHSSEGLDEILIIRKLEYWILNSTGLELVRGKLRNQGEIAVGDFTSSVSGKEIAIRSGRAGAVPILNPKLRGATTFFPVDGLLLNTVEIARFGPYSRTTLAKTIDRCSRIEDKSTTRGKEFKILNTARAGLVLQTRRIFSKVEIETENGTVYPLTFWKSDGKKGAIWKSTHLALSAITSLDTIVGTINDERTCWKDINVVTNG